MGTAGKMASLLSRVSCAAEKIALRSPLKVASVVSPACVSVNQKRNLAVHECVSMALLKDAGVPVPKFGVAKTAAEAKQIAVDIDSNDLAVKVVSTSKRLPRRILKQLLSSPSMWSRGLNLKVPRRLLQLLASMQRKSTRLLRSC